jgi:hypothetical protein
MGRQLIVFASTPDEDKLFAEYRASITAPSWSDTAAARECGHQSKMARQIRCGGRPTTPAVSTNA